MVPLLEALMSALERAQELMSREIIKKNKILFKDVKGMFDLRGVRMNVLLI